MSWLPPLLRDLRYALRLLRRKPSFALLTIGLCACSIAAGTVIFSFADAILWKPLPYRDPTRLVALYERIPVGERYHLSNQDYQAWKQQNRSLTALDVYHPEPLTLRGPGGAEQVAGARVSDGFFRTLGVAPALGRDFFSGEDLPSAPRTVLLSDAAWRKRFAASHSILGARITLDGDPYTIVGVLPADFHFAPVASAEFWITLDGLCANRPSCHPYYGVGRLKEGVTPRAAYLDLQPIAARLAAQSPQSNRDRSATVLPLADAVFGQVRPMAIALLAGAGLLALIGFANISSLLLIRAEGRRREMALRATLGATRAQLIRQFALEGVLLAAAGGILALLLTALLAGVLVRQIPPSALDNMPYLAHIALGGHLVLFALALAALAGAVFTAGPVLQLLSTDLQASLGEGGRSIVGRGWRRAGSTLVVAEWAITMVLLTSAGLLATSFYRLLHEDIGIAADHLALLHVTVLEAETDAGDRALERQILARMTALPGAVSAGITQQLAVAGSESFGNLFKHFRVFGRYSPGQGDEANTHIVSAGYFQTLKTRLLAGRFFRDGDDPAHPRVAIVNRTLAAQFFPGESPLGRRLIDEYDPEHPVEIVGVVDDMKDGPLDMKPTAAVYEPFDQNPIGDFYVTLRTRQSEQATPRAMARAVRGIDPSLLVDGEESMTARIDSSQSAYLHRSAAAVVLGFAGAALLLGVLGLYGVISYSVSQRTREIGMRMALGAPRNAIYRLILSQAGRLAIFGIAGGLAASFATAGLLRTMLYDIAPWDARVLSSVIALLAVAAAAAGYLPARRAASVNPVEALRAE